jgi:galactose mutarotase-like enzyme
MFQVTHVPGALPLVELADTEAGSLAVVAPTRGGMLTRLRAGGVEALYLDESTLRDPTKNVRGGNPVLFPSPGKLAGDAWARDGRRGSLKQHGFARNLPWEITGTETSGGAAVSLRLASSDETRAAYPWDFTFALTYTLRGAGVEIDQVVTNRGDRAMPFGAGFHPYFHVAQAEKGSASIATRATRAFDNVTKQEIAFTGIDLTRAEVDLHLIDHGSSSAALRVAGRTITVSCSPELTRWVVWTLAGRDFVCLEPWTCPGDALNSGDRLIVLAPGESRTLRTGISIG